MDPTLCRYQEPMANTFPANSKIFTFFAAKLAGEAHSFDGSLISDIYHETTQKLLRLVLKLRQTLLRSNFRVGLFSLSEQARHLWFRQLSLVEYFMQKLSIVNLRQIIRNCFLTNNKARLVKNCRATTLKLVKEFIDHPYHSRITDHYFSFFLLSKIRGHPLLHGVKTTSPSWLKLRQQPSVR